MPPTLITLFLPNGDPTGLKVIEISGHTLTGLVIPRIILQDFKNRDEYKRTGVYILVGPSEDSSDTRIYVGEADPVGPRLESHIKNKDFWSHAIVFTAHGNGLNKAHVEHLESRLHKLASQAKRCLLDNGNAPALPTLSEMQKAAAENYLNDILLCLPILNTDFFSTPTKKTASTVEYTIKARGVTASGYESANGFIVQSGSHAAKTAVQIRDLVQKTRDRLIHQKVLVDKTTHYELTQDYEFNSPSLAGACMIGGQCNGRVMWKTSSGQTLRQIQESRL
jgi:hypothetical protein